MTETLALLALRISLAAVAALPLNHLQVSSHPKIGVVWPPGFVAERLCGPGAVALWSESEAGLPAYIAGRVPAGAAAGDRPWGRRIRTWAIGFLTPCYFIRTGSLVSLPEVVSGPLDFTVLPRAQVVRKAFGLSPLVAAFRRECNERRLTRVRMSTGLTFGTLSVLYRFDRGIVSRERDSFLVAAVIAGAGGPTLIATLASIPLHWIPAPPAVAPTLEPRFALPTCKRTGMGTVSKMKPGGTHGRA